MNATATYFASVLTAAAFSYSYYREHVSTALSFPPYRLQLNYATASPIANRYYITPNDDILHYIYDHISCTSQNKQTSVINYNRMKCFGLQ